MLRDYRDIAKKIKEIVNNFDHSARLYVFGSLVKGYYTASSDIDILVVTDRIDLKYDMMVAVYKAIEAPIELHIVTEDKFRDWYLRFIEEDEIIEI
jgi:hypothetical protein